MNNFITIFLLLAGLPVLLSGQSGATGGSDEQPDYFSFPVRGGGDSKAVAQEMLTVGTLKKHSERTGADGRTYVRYRQFHEGAEVLGAEVIVQAAGRQPRRVSGYLAPKTAFASTAAPAENVPDGELERRAKNALLPDYPFARQWNVIDHGDVYTRANPWDDKELYVRCRALELREPAGYAAEMLYLSLRTGKVVLRHPLHCALQRRLHHRNTSASLLVWSEGDAFPGLLDAEDEEMLTATREVYSLYYRTFGRWSYNGTGSLLRTITRAGISGCPNARALGNGIAACAGVVGDDIVGHEWTHNYTKSLNGLLLLFESGAINEAMADIFGEAVDLLNDRGLDANDEQRRDGCFAGNYRWSIAEDATAIDTILRDLWSPQCKTDPVSTQAPGYFCPAGGAMDIHSNSTVVSRTFALLTDGDTTNVDTVRGIGLTKALHIFYHANANYVTRATDFDALATMLRQSARDLQGQNLRALTLVNTIAPYSNQFITAADLASLDAAIAATGLDQAPNCPVEPTLTQNPPAACADSPTGNLVPLLYEDWEAGTVGWTLTEAPGDTMSWDAKPWRRRQGLPDGRAGHALFAPNLHAGNCQADDEHGTVDATSPAIHLPWGEVDFRLRFKHYYALERADGGLVSISRNGEDFVPIPEEAFLYNGYDEALLPGNISDNPLAGQRVFTGTDARSTTGTWGTSVVDLSLAGAAPGDIIRLRWTLGHDGCDGWLGWFLDEVTVGYCGLATLPVEFLSFTAEGRKDHVRLDWRTAREVNNAGFWVERSADGRDFEPLDFVAAGDEYTFADFTPLAGQTYYYRLRQEDLDGTNSLSPTVTARLTGERHLVVYPNPTHGAFTVRNDGREVRVYDLNGRLVRETGGEETRITGLQAGVYVVRAGERTARVVVR